MSLAAATSDPAAAPFVSDLLAHTRADVAAAMAERERINESTPVNLHAHLHSFDVPLTAAAAVALVVVLAVVAILLKRRCWPATGIRTPGVCHSLVTTVPVAAISPDAKASRPTSLARDVPLGHDGADAHAHAVAQALLAAGRRTSRTPRFELLPSSVALSPLLEAADDSELLRTVDLSEEGRPSSASYSDVTAVNSSCAAAAGPAPDQGAATAVKVGWPIPRASLQHNTAAAAVTHPLLVCPSEASLVCAQDQSTEVSPVTPKTVVKPKAAVAPPKRMTAVPPRLSLLPPLPVTVGRDGRISLIPQGTPARMVRAEPDLAKETITIDPEPPRPPSLQPRSSDASSIPTLTPQPRPSEASSIPTLAPPDADDEQLSPPPAHTAPMLHVDPRSSPVSTVSSPAPVVVHHHMRSTATTSPWRLLKAALKPSRRAGIARSFRSTTSRSTASAAGASLRSGPASSFYALGGNWSSVTATTTSDASIPSFVADLMDECTAANGGSQAWPDTATSISSLGRSITVSLDSVDDDGGAETEGEDEEEEEGEWVRRPMRNAGAAQRPSAGTPCASVIALVPLATPARVAKTGPR
ncbi:hypothetical protein AMAG_09224 [Allomyces macrogynus ATCC 38327]|uniref:Uncharacterized protein n=1 Tax=Allomyces macrogynus (strain ATCC 38327) TaxID=578462 RepID=A0A0L0SNS8_ALLM3|nr:hypothetical protein AMAG_09224 [Allomyces macrogynus ATCC 38327]|eukprot:KNE64181.1 hypothetical protein AMAG_09224 [Allomyces macrogynus ATCC 38327]